MTHKTYLRLSELNAAIAGVLGDAFGRHSFWLVADITSHTYKPTRQYHSFELVEKDEHAQQIVAKMSCKAWGLASGRIQKFEEQTGQRFGNDIHVLIRVQVSFHNVYGLSLNLLDIDAHFTLGVLARQRMATLERLVAENAFIQKEGERFRTRNSELPLPHVIQKIALISSVTSAGAEDFKHTLQHNTQQYRFEIDDYFSAVQGEANANQLLSGLLQIFHAQKDYDAVVIIRGGGAQADLLIFDNYEFGRAVAKFPIPVITGIGHQKDETITDLMAHTATKTPTRAAEFIIAHNKTFEDSTNALLKQMLLQAQQLLTAYFQELSRQNNILVNSTHLILNSYKDGLRQRSMENGHHTRSLLFGHKSRLLQVMAPLPPIFKGLLHNQAQKLNQVSVEVRSLAEARLRHEDLQLRQHCMWVRMMDRDFLLKKGFSIVYSEGKPVREPEQLRTGSKIDILMANTVVKAVVTEKRDKNG